MVWERGKILHSTAGLGYLSREECALEGERFFLAKRLPRKNVRFDRPSSRFLSSLSLYRLAKL